MVLDIPGGLFGQDDVRETAVAVEGTIYWSCSGGIFTASSPDTNDVVNAGSKITMSGSTIILSAPVFLPHGAVITAVICYGSETDESWYLRRGASNGTYTEMGTANFNTEDTTITTPTVNNIDYNYFLSTTSLDATDEIYGAKITYTI